MKVSLKKLLNKMLAIRPDWNQTDSTKYDYIKNKPNIKEIAYGTKSVTQTSAQTSHRINYGRTFSSAPTIVVTIEDTDGIFWSPWIYARDTTGFGLNTYWSGFNGNRSLKIHWVAIL